jgi:leader peptidase (prepilin peptidase) / N-methyltransferase
MSAPVQVLLAGVLGALVGSFLNVVVHRLPRGESLALPGSCCPSCGTPIKPYDNVPVVSWFLLLGRCRHCAAPIPVRYPALELLTALAFAAVVAVHGVDERLVLELPFVAVLIAVAGIDLEHRIVPNRILLPAAIWGLGAAVLVATPDLPELLIAGAAAFALLLAAAVAYPAGMGMGDVKLAGVMGLYLGLSVAPALFVAFAAGTIVGLAVIALGGGDRKTAVPFAPFLAAGGLVALLAGSELIELYSDRFLA